MPYKTREDKIEYHRKYRQSEHYKNWQKKYKESGKRKAYMYEYNRLPRTLEYRKKYNERVGSRFRDARTLRRNATLDGMGGKCVECGFSDYRALQIDHIKGDGKSERHLLRRNDYYENVLKSFTRNEERYQILCCNCNWIKRAVNGEYRKKPENQ